MGWKHQQIADERRKLLARFEGAPREDLLARIVELETSLYTMTAALSDLDMPIGHRCSARMTSNLFPAEGDDGFKVLTIDNGAPKDDRVGYRDVPPEDKWHETQFCSVDSLTIYDGTKIHDEFEVLAVHQSAIAAYIGCGGIYMGDIRKAAKLLWDEKPTDSSLLAKGGDK